MIADSLTDEEVGAAVVALFAVAAASSEPDDDEAPSLWRDRSALVRAPLLAGRGSWRASALPR